MKKLFYQFIIFITIIVLGQVIVARYMTAQIPEIALLDKYLRDETQIIYFGSSDIKHAPLKDTDRSSIVEMLSKINPAYTIGDISQNAYYLGIFEALFKHISKSPIKPKAVVIPISLMSFSPGWDKFPGLQFEREQFYFTKPPLIAYFFRPLTIMRAINTNEVIFSEYQQLPVYYGKEKIGIVSDFDNPKYRTTTTENISNKFIFLYMGSLDKNHRKLKSLDNIIDLADKAGIKLYVYINPIDFKNGERYVGPDFVKQTTANTETICSILKEKNLPCLNLAFSLDSSYFDYSIYPGEHFNEKGRKFIAEQVNRFFPK